MENTINKSVNKILEKVIMIAIVCLLIPVWLFSIQNDKIEKLQNKLDIQSNENKELTAKIKRLESKQIDHTISIIEMEKKHNGK